MSHTHTLSLSLLFSHTYTHTHTHSPSVNYATQVLTHHSRVILQQEHTSPTIFFAKWKEIKLVQIFSSKLKMVVKTQVVPSTLSSSQKMARRLLRKYRKGGSRTRAARADSYWRLKKLVPSISRKDNISKLDVVLEAISYIQRLQDDLLLSVLKGSSRNCWKKISSAT